MSGELSPWSVSDVRKLLQYREDMKKFNESQDELSTPARERAVLLWDNGLVNTRRELSKLTNNRVEGDRCKKNAECESKKCEGGVSSLKLGGKWGICRSQTSQAPKHPKYPEPSGTPPHHLMSRDALTQRALAAASRLEINPEKQPDFHADDSVPKQYAKIKILEQKKDDRVKKNLEEQKERGVNVRKKLMTIINNADIEKRNNDILKELDLPDPKHTDVMTIEGKVISLGLDDLLKLDGHGDSYTNIDETLDTIVRNLKQKSKTTGGKKKRKHHTRKHKKSNRKSNRKSKHHKKSHKGGNKKSNRKTHKRTKHHKKRGHKSRRRR
jgi:hypothetical protein